MLIFARPLVPDLDQPTLADDQNEPYLDYLHGVLKLPNSKLPQTISHSYGEDEQVRSPATAESNRELT